MKQGFRNKLPENSPRWLVRKILRKLHGKFDRYIRFDDTLMMVENERFKGFEVGEFSYSHPDGSPRIVHFGEPNKLKIGKFCSFAEEVTIMLGGGYHRADWVTTYPFSVLFDGVGEVKGVPFAKGDIVIGNDVWVCTGATIIAGVTIGNGAIVAARSVVTRDVAPYSVVAGNPAKVVKQRFSDDIVSKLNEIQWWNWPVEKVRQEFAGLLSSDIEVFVDKHYTGSSQNDIAETAEISR